MQFVNLAARNVIANSQDANSNSNEIKFNLKYIR